MSELFALLGSTRQAHGAAREVRSRRHERADSVVALIRLQREEHPRIGLRKLYERHHAELAVGRDTFIAIGELNGLGIEPRRSARRTTFAGDGRRFPNLLIGLKLNDVNQVWVSDLTYYPVGLGFSYITLVMDLYSRRIVGYVVARSMHARWTVAAIEQALQCRSIGPQHQLIVHSDQGGQYLSQAAQMLIASVGARISTCEIVYENSHSERLNGVIKQEYLDAWAIPTHESLEQCVSLAVERYNTTRPHGSLKMRSPLEFEADISQIALEDRPQLAVWPPTPLKKLSHGVDVPYKL
jgi:transposase InsO family protein